MLTAVSAGRVTITVGSASADVRAVGTGIGNTAAHEIAHQFFLNSSGMEDGSVGTYSGAVGCDPTTAGGYNYGFGTIVWEAVTFNAWKSVLGTGWHK